MNRIAAVYATHAHQASFLQRSIDRILCWQQRLSQRHQLGQLSDSMLSDIGLSRADVDMEVSKPFWRS
ncbi:MAG TPA: DUF1127 domain-containing protein [Kiloniellales bacterium]|nr:DUF1127 domain-containing protein [Kiloniellales bacterium]